MRYMMLIYSQENDGASREEHGALAMRHRAVMEEAQRNGVLLAADPLEPTASATTVRRKDGETLITDGPFAESKEQLAGYYLLDCRNLDEAIEWAAKIPTACLGGSGCVEIRPLREMRNLRVNG